MSDDISKIFPGFYIGSLAAVKRDVLDDYQITHVLSVMNGYKPKWPKMYNFKVIDIYDMEDVNIKQYFDQTFEFIEAGRQEGAVLVHCFAGMSRSASVCIAYLMRKLNISYQDAHDLLQDARSIIYPNPGFVRQLHEYELELKKKKKAQQSKKQKEVEEEKEESIDKLSSTLENQQIETTKEEEIMEEVFINQYKYCCRKCSKVLFHDSDITEHLTGVGQTGFRWNKRDRSIEAQVGGNGEEESNTTTTQTTPHNNCTSFFLNQNEWMTNNVSVGGNDGKIACDNPKCGEKLGSWSWSGAQCSCGAWISPSFQIPKSRVDEKFIKPPTSTVPNNLMDTSNQTSITVSSNQ